VRMREEDRINLGNVVRQRLLTEVGGGIDENPHPFEYFDVDRRTEAAIANVR